MTIPLDARSAAFFHLLKVKGHGASLARLIPEGEAGQTTGFGEGLVSFTQHPSLIPVYTLGNCNTQIYLALQHEDDIATSKRALFLERGDEVFLDWLRVGEGIVKIKGRIDPCHVKFPLVPVVKGAIADGVCPNDQIMRPS